MSGPLPPAVITDATLDTIDAALFTALAALQAVGATLSAATPFRVVDRWYGAVSDKDGLATFVLDKLPCAVLALASDAGDNDAETLAGEAETRGRTAWVVFVAADDPRGPSQLLKGSGTVGVYAMLDAVLAALNGLAVDNLLRATRVRWVSTVPVSQRQGVGTVHGLTFRTDRSVATVTYPDATVPLTSVGTPGDLNLYDGDTQTYPALVNLDAPTT